MKNLVLKLGLSALTFFVLLLVLELGLSIAGYGRLVTYTPDRDLYWRPTPKQNVYTKIGRRPVRVNSHGTRGPEFETVKPAGTFRIICLGDSRTFGWGLSEEETYARKLETLLRSRTPPGRRVEVINAGVNAWSYPQMKAFLTLYGLSYSPDLVILDGANLWNAFTQDQTDEFRRSFLRKVRLKNILRRSAIYHYFVEIRLQKYYEKYRKNAIPMPVRPDEEQFDELKNKALRIIEESLGSMRDQLVVEDVDLILLHIPREDESTSQRSEYVKAIKKRIAGDGGCTFLDLTGPFAESPRDLFLEADPIHPNVEGNAIVAEQLSLAVEMTGRFRSFRDAGP